MNLYSLLAFIAFASHAKASYINYYIQQYCEENPDRRILIGSDGQYSTLTLGSAAGRAVANETCRVRVISDSVAGIIAVVNNITLKNVDTECGNYLKFNESMVWCSEEDSLASVVFNTSDILIEFGTGINTSAYFELVLTTYSGLWNKSCSNPNHIRCHGGNQECIHKSLECDGIHNCPTGSDEHDCPAVQSILSPDESPEIAYSANETAVDEKVLSNDSSTQITTVITTTTTSPNVSTTLSPTTQTKTIPTTTSSTTTSAPSTTTIISTTVSTSSPEISSSPPHTTVEPEKPISSGKTAALVLVIISLFILVTGSAIYMYRKQANNREPLYSPL